MRRRPRHPTICLRSWLALLLSLASPLAATPPVPEPLKPWVPWVLAKHPELACPLLDGERLCAWPGRLTLDLDDHGGSFSGQLRRVKNVRLAARFIIETLATWAIHIKWDRSPESFDPQEARENAIAFIVEALAPE